MNGKYFLQRKFVVVLTLVMVSTLLLAVLAYLGTSKTWHIAKTSKAQVTAVPAKSPIPLTTPPVTPTATAVPPRSSSVGSVLGVDGKPNINYPDIPWVRLSYPTCGWGNLTGDVLKNTIQQYHHQGVQVMLTFCQPSPDPHILLNPQPLKDAAQGSADAVQCGNEQMKQDQATMYIAPDLFAQFYDLCERSMHAVRPEIPVIIGSLDPHVGGIDYWPLVDQVYYLDAMQQAMNASVHPGGHWNWRSQIVGLIDSWHNGYPSQSTNSLYWLFVFWAQQFNVDLNSGALGKHLWVIEGTGCFKGCGIDDTSSYQVAVSHILTLLTDVQTTMRYKVPFFYFSGNDFYLDGILWPMGVVDAGGHPKPIRQDLGMGDRTLMLTCSNRGVTVSNQEQLLARLYSGCALPGNYIDILAS